MTRFYSPLASTVVGKFCCLQVAFLLAMFLRFSRRPKPLVTFQCVKDETNNMAPGVTALSVRNNEDHSVNYRQ